MDGQTARPFMPSSHPQTTNTELQDERLKSVLQVVSDENAADPG